MTSLRRLGVYGFAAICSAIFMYPLLFSLLSSFKNNTEIYGGQSQIFALPKEWLWGNFTMAFKDAHIHSSVFTSFLYAAAGTAVALLLGTMASYVLARFTFKINGFLYIYFILGLMIPVFSLVIPISRMVGSIDGFNNYFVMVVLYGVFELPLTIFLITGFMKGIHKEIDESALMDGCGPLLFLFRILAPLAMPAISTAGILAFFNIYNDLLWNVILITDRDMYNISMALMSFVGERGSAQMGPTFASISLTIIPTVVVYLLFQEKVEGGLSAGAVKA